jgi:hypothetical protein
MKSPRWYDRNGEARWEGDVRTARRENALPSVTSICDMWPKGWLEYYVKRQMWEAARTTPRARDTTDDQDFKACCQWADEHRERAADRGTRIHRCIHGTQKPEPDIAPFFDAWSKWNASENHQVLWQEKTLVNLECGYAGQADRLLTGGNWQILDDFKTSAVKDKRKPPFYDNYPIQLAAYREALPNPHAVTCRSIVINTLEPEPPYVRVWTVDEIAEGWKRFRICYEMFASLKNYDPREYQP